METFRVNVECSLRKLNGLRPIVQTPIGIGYPKKVIVARRVLAYLTKTLRQNSVRSIERNPLKQYGKIIKAHGRYYGLTMRLTGPKLRCEAPL